MNDNPRNISEFELTCNWVCSFKLSKNAHAGARTRGQPISDPSELVDEVA